jgi:hypothetical protein
MFNINILRFSAFNTIYYISKTATQIATSKEYRFARYQMELGGHHTEPSLRRKDFKDLQKDFYTQSASPVVAGCIGALE